MTPATGLCPVCGRERDLRPDGTVARHYDDLMPASVKHCQGGLKAAARGTLAP